MILVGFVKVYPEFELRVEPRAGRMPVRNPGCRDSGEAGIQFHRAHDSGATHGIIRLAMGSLKSTRQ